jgi:hypothetical protein
MKESFAHCCSPQVLGLCRIFNDLFAVLMSSWCPAFSSRAMQQPSLLNILPTALSFRAVLMFPSALTVALCVVFGFSRNVLAGDSKENGNLQ